MKRIALTTLLLLISTNKFLLMPTEVCAAAPGHPARVSMQTGSAADQWRIYNSANFSFTYPPWWKLSEAPDRNEAFASDPNTGYAFHVKFMPGVKNNATTFNQCASADAILQDVYQREYELPLSTRAAGQYPFTTVTNDGFGPGRLGGESTWISIVHQEAYQNPVSYQVWVNVVPRAGGMYIVYYTHAAALSVFSEPLRKAFTDSISFRSEALDKNAYCNYLGH